MCYPGPVEWSEGQREGFALAAAVCEDAGAAGAEAGLGPDCREHVLTAAQALWKRERRERRRWVRARLRPARTLSASQAGRSARALSLLASRAPAEVGQVFLAAAPMPRPGFVPDPALVELLHRIASRPSRGET